MGNLVQAVAKKVRNLPARHEVETQDNLTAAEKEALREAARLADLFEDVKPEQSRISSNRLFIHPDDE